MMNEKVLKMLSEVSRELDENSLRSRQEMGRHAQATEELQGQRNALEMRLAALLSAGKELESPEASKTAPESIVSVMPRQTSTETEIEVAAQDRNATILFIKNWLKERSGKPWSVRGGTGTSWGWIVIKTKPGREVDGRMSLGEAEELKTLLGLDRADYQGISIPASTAHRREYCYRAAGLTPPEIAKAYWD